MIQADEPGLSEKELNAILDPLVKGLTRRLVERVLEGEMTAHLGYEKHAQEGRDGGNFRNGGKDPD